MKGATAADAGRTALFALRSRQRRGQAQASRRRRARTPRSTTSRSVPRATVYVSDSASGTIYAATARDARRLEVVVGPGQLGSPQGMAVSADGRRLYVFGLRSRPIFASTSAGRHRIRLRAPPRARRCSASTAWQRRAMSDRGTERRASPTRSCACACPSDRQAVVSAEPLDAQCARDSTSRRSASSAPEGFVYVANSQDGKFRDAHGDFTKYKAAEPLLLRIPTAQLCP